MYNPEIYVKSNQHMKTLAENFLQKYSNKIQCKKHPSVLDLGSGDGSVTVTILKKYIPSGYREIRGVDISPNMVDFANERYKDDRISFSLMDIVGDVPKEFEARFDIAFSSFALNWITDQKKAFRNIYEMLAEDGKCLLTIGGQSDVYDVYIELANSQKWKKHVNNDDYVSVYHLMKDPLNEVRKTMGEVGFKNVEVNGVPIGPIYQNLDDFRNLLKALNLLKIPEEMLEEHLDDLIKLSIEREALTKPTEDSYKFEIMSIQLYGTK